MHTRRLEVSTVDQRSERHLLAGPQGLRCLVRCVGEESERIEARSVLRPFYGRVTVSCDDLAISSREAGSKDLHPARSDNPVCARRFFDTWYRRSDIKRSASYLPSRLRSCSHFGTEKWQAGIGGVAIDATKWGIPGLDIVSIAKGYGCDAARLDNLEEIKKAAVEAWSKSKPTVLEIPISRQAPPLI